MPAFDTLLIANRGEIAARIIRTARSLGLRTVAVFSEADADGLAVALADEAVCIGPAAASASYLNVEAILAAARQTGAGAIHPGYGFLSENAGFARAVLEAGLVWVGPPPHAIEVMGDKARAKARAIEAGVPTVPGFQGSQEPARLALEAERIGYPVLLKASAGGGGRGMRRVTRPEDLADAIAGASAEAQAAFANGELILEKLVEHARHIEIQVFGDQHGNVIHLGERDCSAQRRHQKIIEEAPSPAVDGDLRARMGEAAVAAAAAIGYVGAGTVEFLLASNGDSSDFYFLEMNTRLQVEHPVTEAITGFDLVEWQLEIAMGGQLPVGQDEVVLVGHAIEARFYAEDPAAGFLPQTGEILAWQPEQREGLRIDHGLRVGIGEGQQIGADYDPMVAKVIAHGATREQARRRLLAGLRGTVLLGPTTNKTFLLDLLSHPAFIAGEVTTQFVEHHPSARELGRMPEAPDGETVALAGLIWLEAHRDPRHTRPGTPATWTNAHGRLAGFDLRCGARTWTVTAEQHGSTWLLSCRPPAAPRRMRVLAHEGAHLRFECDARQRMAHFAWTEGGELQLELDARTWTFAEHRPHEAAATSEGSDGTVRAPTMGRVLKVAVALGEVVEVGSRLLTLEAMKIESIVLAPIAGTIAELRIAVGDQVDKRQVLVKIEPN